MESGDKYLERPILGYYYFWQEFFIVSLLYSYNFDEGPM